MIEPPIEPMLAKLAGTLPEGGGFLYEPKWDGFRALVFRGADGVFIQSRDLKPLDRYFPELHALFLERLPAGCVLDGEIVIATPRGLDFDALFLQFMIQHHEGAITMVNELFARGAGEENPVYKIASGVFADQTTEIERMQHMLAAKMFGPTPTTNPR